MAKDELLAKALKAGINPPSTAKAPGKAKAKSGASAVLANATQLNLAPPTIQEPEHGGFFDTPIIKNILDALSTGVYTGANIADFATAGDDKKKQIMGEIVNAASKGDTLGAAIDFIGSQLPGGAVPAGAAKGLSAGLGGNKADADTYANAIVNLQHNAGIDTESEESKLVQGAGGFAADVLLDPLNVVGLGPVPKMVKGLSVGAREFKEAKAAEKLGEALPESIAPTKWENAKKVAGEELNNYRQLEYDKQQAKVAAKQIKRDGASDEVKAKFLTENVHALRPGVYKAIRNSMEDESKLVDKIVTHDDTEKILDALVKGDDDIPNNIMEPKDILPNVEPHLGDIKKLTMEQKLADELGKMRTIDRKPIYSEEVANNVEKLREAKASIGKKPTNKDYLTLGIKEEHLPMMRAGTKVMNVTDEISSGSIRHITRDIRSGVIPETALTPLYEITGTTNPTDIAKFIKETVNKDSFKEAAKAIGSYGTHRTGETPLPYLGTSGHKKLAIPGKGFTPGDIKASYFPTNPEDSRKFLESKYQFHATELARHPKGAELRVVADDVFKAVVNKQREEAGPLRTKRGASQSVKRDAAKFETKWNTHSNIFRIAEVSKRVKAMGFKGRNAYDDAWMKVMADVDNRLRLAGIDPHLSNMKLMSDKMVVRLAPSDVFGAMTQTDRIKYIHGNLRYAKTSIKEFLPSTILDMAEVMVRSATKLLPNGAVDMEHLVNTAMATLNGRYSKFVDGPREIGQNLDIFSYNKGNFEVLQEIDRKIGTDYAKQFKALDSQADRINLINVVKASDPKDFKLISMKRMQEVPTEILGKFLKGMDSNGAEAPNMLTQLINTNMRNASVFGGNVARPIGEASAEYTQRILDALESGTAGDFLSELVLRPPYSTMDEVARQIVSENQKLVQRSVATESEIKSAYALNRNVKGTGRASANNAEAFQKSDAIVDELNQPIKDIDKENLFDLSNREFNKDILYRIHGPQRRFNRRAGMRFTYDAVVGSSHATSLIQTGMHGLMRNWRARGISSDMLRVGMQDLKNGNMTPVASEIEQVMNTLFDPSANNFLTRNSVGPDHFNRILKSVGFDPEIFKVAPDATPEEMNKVWRDWPIHNVEDFISKMTGAMVKTAEDVSVGAAISAKFGKTVAEKGYVKLTDKSGKNPLFPLIDDTLYYPQEVANEFVHIGRLMTESRGFKPGTGLYTFVSKIMDPVINLLKMTQTTLKPGHHIMSITGDMWRNNLALAELGMINPSKQFNLYLESARIMRTNIGPIAELDSLQQFKRIQNATTDIKIRQDNGGSEFYANIAGGGRITHDSLYKLMQAYGVALPAHMSGVAEDIISHTDQLDSFAKKTGNIAVDAVSRVTSGMDRLANPLKPKFGRDRPYSLNAFTAHRDTWTRGALFLGAMRSKRFKTVEEAAEYASGIVKKWAPTAIDLGAFEAKYARRAIFYYTWIRGMVPRIIESALMHPGIATVPNKLMYNVAVANGVDPTSIGDPFPEGQLFPDWYSERVIGPQWEEGGDLWGINPTGPLGDIMNSLGSNVKPKDFLTADAFTKVTGTFLNMSTPWFKAPAELIQGRTLDRGIPIADKAQYVQDMFGPARTLSRAIGKDLYPAVNKEGKVVLPNRTEKKYAGGLDGSVFQPGSEANQNALPELFNWATGTNLTNYTSDSSSNSAYYQQKDAKLAERKQAKRLES
jgi:hypothetical protein